MCKRGVACHRGRGRRICKVCDVFMRAARTGAWLAHLRRCTDARELQSSGAIPRHCGRGPKTSSGFRKEIDHALERISVRCSKTLKVDASGEAPKQNHLRALPARFRPFAFSDGVDPGIRKSSIFFPARIAADNPQSASRPRLAGVFGVAVFRRDCPAESRLRSGRATLDRDGFESSVSIVRRSATTLAPSAASTRLLRPISLSMDIEFRFMVYPSLN